MKFCSLLSTLSCWVGTALIKCGLKPSWANLQLHTKTTRCCLKENTLESQHWVLAKENIIMVGGVNEGLTLAVPRITGGECVVFVCDRLAVCP